ncbi:sulfatase-like hydrolase/transferase [Campylobacter canadensis]|uniref:LTA synthase family protein n=2 Tax=Campylobacter canadensis TaxID=449520 RepID=UPI0015546D96|nr:alkaline phosphatase family protein [Campylobacter canadensis]MBZ7994842.1 sulfatase-like hydrolase/transferase [Campylobacter canadensis]MBZ8000121.1 sulfatase-like hydrolase/transferase [Campylobacter canadensis]MBZ8003205.1 sulfatase-like hydrolase/transferase [Campylobacter canadensis]
MLAIIFINLYFVFCFFIFRILALKNLVNLNDILFYKYDLFMFFKHSLLYDFRAVFISFAPLIIFKYLRYFSDKFFRILSLFYTFIISFLLSIFAVLGYYYYEAYKSKVDIFIFNAINDDKAALFEIIINNYPFFTMLFLTFANAVFITYFFYKINTLRLFKINKKFIIFILNLLFLFVYFLACRGSINTFPLKEADLNFSKFSAFNNLSANPALAFTWAYKHYKNQSKFYNINFEDLNKEYKNIFDEDIIKSTKKDEFLEQNKAHVVFNLMESFGINMLSLHDDKHDLLGSLKEHFKQDFVFTRFLSSHNGTAPSFSGLYLLSPYSNLFFSSKKSKKLSYTVFDVYKKAGYKIIFITSANSAWQNLSEYLKVQGVDELYDMSDFLLKYPKAKESLNAYGVADEFMYKQAYELLSKAKEPLFIAMLSISNHPSFKIPTDFKENIKYDEILNKLNSKDDKEYLKNSLKAYAYSNDAFGKFISKIKSSPLADNTIIAASGDHKNRDMDAAENDFLANDYAVPFYIYIPKKYQKDIYYDKQRAGSHKDIFPTLYELSLSDAKYLNIGGKNMLSKVKNQKLEFGINELFYIDNNVSFNNVASFKLDKCVGGGKIEFLLCTKNTKDSYYDEKIKQFSTLYKKIYFDEINYRLMD